MPRLSKTAALERTLRDAFGRNTLNTRSGQLAGESKTATDAINQALQPDGAFRYEIPTRDHMQAMIVQEMVMVSSRLRRAVNKLASDSSMDSMAASQPYTVMVHEKNEPTRRKIFEAVQAIMRRTNTGLKGYQRYQRGLLTGDVVGQPVYSQSGPGGRYRLEDVVYMPTWDMHYDMKTRIWSQKRASTYTDKSIFTWPVENFMCRFINERDDNYPYGTSLLLANLTNYYSYIMSLEDLGVHFLFGVTRKILHYLGSENGNWRVDPEALADFQARHEAQPKDILLNYYLAKGFEDVDQLEGDAQGSKALLSVVQFYESRMLEDLGLPVNMKDLAGKHVSDSVDTSYAYRINQLRQNDTWFLLDVIRKGLILEGSGYADVDIDINIPPLGESASLVQTSASNALQGGEIGYPLYCARVGIKDPDQELLEAAKYMQWRKDNELPLDGTAQAPGMESANGNPSESSDMGGDSKAGDQRRRQQIKSGQQPTGK